MKYIFQTWRSHDLSLANPVFQKSQESWKSHHPDWDYGFFNDDEINALVSTHFPGFFKKYFIRYRGQIKRVDLFRYCNLFLRGGLYSDLDGECVRPCDDLLDCEAVHIIGSLHNEQSSNRYPNATMMSKLVRGNFWLFVLAMACERFEDNRGYYSTEYLTGPILLTEAIERYRKDEPIAISAFIARYLPDASRHGISCHNPIEKELIQIVEPDVFYPIDWHRFSKEERQEIIEMRLSRGEIPQQFIEPCTKTLNYWTHSWNVPQYSLSDRVLIRLRYYRFKIARFLAG